MPNVMSLSTQKRRFFFVLFQTFALFFAVFRSPRRYLQIKFVPLSPAIRSLRQRCHLRMTEPRGGALHIRRRYVALFFGLRNFHNRTTVKNIAGVTPRGVSYTLRSVLRFREIVSKLLTISVYLFCCLCVSNKMVTIFLLLLLLFD